MSKNSRLVYSTETGRIKPSEDEREALSATDGIIRIRRESKGRAGKSVCVIDGFTTDEIKPIAKLLKSRCATGGAIKNGTIEIQGDHRDLIKSLIEQKGHQVKFTGG